MLSTGTGERRSAFQGSSDRARSFGESSGALSSAVGGLAGLVDAPLGDGLDGPLDYAALFGSHLLKGLEGL